MPLSFSELSGRYNELWRETSALYEAWARQNGLSYHELLVVLSIAQARGPCTQKTICAQWAVPKQTVHSVLQGFLARGLVPALPARATGAISKSSVRRRGALFLRALHRSWMRTRPPCGGGWARSKAKPFWPALRFTTAFSERSVRLEVG